MARPSAELAGGDSELGRLFMAIAVLGIDLGKNSCSVVGLDGTGQVILRRRMQRKSIAVLGAKLSRASLQWRPAVVPIILAGFFQPWDTRFG